MHGHLSKKKLHRDDHLICNHAFQSSAILFLIFFFHGTIVGSYIQMCIFKQLVMLMIFFLNSVCAFGTWLSFSRMEITVSLRLQCALERRREKATTEKEKNKASFYSIAYLEIRFKIKCFLTLLNYINQIIENGNNQWYL